MQLVDVKAARARIAKATTVKEALEILDEEAAKRRGAYECFNCLSVAVIWQADYTFEDYGVEGEGIVHACHCMCCGADIEYYVPMEVDT